MTTTTLKPQLSDEAAPPEVPSASESLRFDPKRSAFAHDCQMPAITMSDLHFGVAGRPLIAGRGFPFYHESAIDSFIQEVLSDRCHLVLNGDIFEMVYDEPQASVDKRLTEVRERTQQWISTAKKSGAMIHLVIGNHDDAPELYDTLSEMTAQHPDHFRVHPVALRIGSSLYTHGDLAFQQQFYEDMDTSKRSLGREKFMGYKVVKHLPPALQQLFERLSVCGNAKSHYIVQNMRDLRHDAQEEANALHQALKDSELMGEMTLQDGTTLPEVSDVITGHTHTPYHNITVDGVRHHNTGSAMERGRFQPLVCRFNDDGQVKTNLLTPPNPSRISPEVQQRRAWEERVLYRLPPQAQRR